MKNIAVALVTGVLFTLTTVVGALAGLIGDIARAQLPGEARGTNTYRRARGGDGPAQPGGSRAGARRSIKPIQAGQRAV